eukprot:44779_1
MLQIISVQDIQSIVRKNGLKLKIVTEDVTYIFDKLQEEGIVYYVTPKYIDSSQWEGLDCRSWNAVLLHEGRNFIITRCTLQAIDKWLKDEQNCNICFDPKSETGSCGICGLKYCAACCIQLTHPNYKYNPNQLSSINYEKPILRFMPCPQCKQLANLDILRIYYKAMDDLDKLTKDQRALVLHLASHDYAFQHKFNYFKQSEKEHAAKQHKKSKQFLKGNIVKISGLEAKIDWNGKFGAIIGEFIKEKQRWPVRVNFGDKPCALLKSKNLTLKKST